MSHELSGFCSRSEGPAYRLFDELNGIPRLWLLFGLQAGSNLGPCSGDPLPVAALSGCGGSP